MSDGMVRPLVIGIIVAVVVTVVVISIVAAALLLGGAGGGGPPLKLNFTSFKFEDVGLNFSFSSPQGWTQSREGTTFTFTGPSFAYQGKANVTTKLEGEYFNTSSSAAAAANMITARYAGEPDYKLGERKNDSFKLANNSTARGILISLTFSRQLNLSNKTVKIPIKRQAFVLDTNSTPYYSVSLEALATDYGRAVSAFNEAKKTLKYGAGLPPPPPPPPEPEVCTNSCPSGYTRRDYPDCTCVPPPLPGGTATLPVYYEKKEVFSFDKAKVESERFGGVSGDGALQYNEGKELKSPTYGLHPLGEVDFDSLLTWKKEMVRSVAVAKPNHVYIIRTASQKWAKIKVTEAATDSVTFQWVYNPDTQTGENVSFQPG